MRFYKEIWGFIWEFNSPKDYVDFTIGRMYGLIFIILLFYFLFFS